jgi:hypothetical protein
VLSWEDLDAFWGVVRNNAGAGWYVYAIGESPPAAPATAEQVDTFITEVDALLRREHEEDYCGIVYTDSKTEPFDGQDLRSQQPRRAMRLQRQPAAAGLGPEPAAAGGALRQGAPPGEPQALVAQVMGLMPSGGIP